MEKRPNSASGSGSGSGGLVGWSDGCGWLAHYLTATCSRGRRRLVLIPLVLCLILSAAAAVSNTSTEVAAAAAAATLAVPRHDYVLTHSNGKKLSKVCDNAIVEDSPGEHFYFAKGGYPK
jgi:hypothetical protein